MMHIIIIEMIVGTENRRRVWWFQEAEARQMLPARI